MELACAVGAHRLTLRPLAAADAAELERIHRTPEVARWWDLPAAGFPWDEPEAERLTIVVDGRVAGLVQATEETEPKYRHAAIDVFLDPALHGRGLGAAAVWLLARRLVEERGHHRVTIDPAADNVAAIRAYEKVGFRPIGRARRAERDSDGRGWHDALLMDVLDEELTRPACRNTPPG